MENALEKFLLIKKSHNQKNNRLFRKENKEEEQDKMTFYSYTKNNIKYVLKNYFSQHKNYLKDKENIKFYNLYLLFDKFNIDHLEILQIDELMNVINKI